jgi:two-component system response regulator FixJ
MPNEPIVYVVDDDEAVRDSLEILLETSGFTARSFDSALSFLAATAKLPPGCLVADVRMPEMDGLELQERLSAAGHRFPVIIITGHGDVPIAVRAMKAGAVDFIEKPFANETIIESVRLALARLEQSSEQDAAGATATARLALLTPRERQVLVGLVSGMPNKTIAYDLEISPRTVEIYRARVMDKMQAGSLPELVRLALAAGVAPKSP